jgi:DNA-binding PadR family transcriptional regulator
MKRAFLGEFEEVVLLAVVVAQPDAYGVTIREEIEKRTGRSVTLSAIHATLHRLEDKGYLSSQMSGATAERGGRRKRFFAVTAVGGKALVEIQQVRTAFWKAIPGGLPGLSGT